MELYFFFTGGLDEYNYAEQHADAFPELRLDERAEIRYVEACTHMVTDLQHQRLFLDDMREWARHFGSTVREPTAAAS